MMDVLNWTTSGPAQFLLSVLFLFGLFDVLTSAFRRK